LFSEQLIEAVNKYPNLRIIYDDSGMPFLQGILDIPNDINETVGYFLIELHRSENFPFRFPILFETGGEIPNEADWHKYKDGSCCITVWTDEILKCKNGVTISYFIEKYAIPYFANQIHKKQTGEYKNGEYAHGIKGIFQFYEALFKTSNTDLWIEYFKNAFRNLKVDCRRNDLCFCGSKEKYKNCHSAIFQTLQQIGEKRVFNDFSLIIK
jgi:hypothetical protein